MSHTHISMLENIASALVAGAADTENTTSDSVDCLIRHQRSTQSTCK
jgi:hypothetical protein